MSALKLPALILVVYAWLFPWLPQIRSPNELSRLYQAIAIAEHGTVAIDAVTRARGGTGDTSSHEGRTFPNKAPGVSFAGAPVELSKTSVPSAATW